MSTLFPYTTLFRSCLVGDVGAGFILETRDRQPAGCFTPSRGASPGGLVDSGRELARQKSFILNVADCEFFRRRQDSAKARKEDSPRLGTPRSEERRVGKEWRKRW